MATTKNDRIKIRIYHWWLYSLFFKIWNPILKQNPQMVRAIRQGLDQWLETHAKPQNIGSKNSRVAEVDDSPST